MGPTLKRNCTDWMPGCHNRETQRLRPEALRLSVSAVLPWAARHYFNLRPSITDAIFITWYIELIFKGFSINWPLCGGYLLNKILYRDKKKSLIQ